MKLDPFVEERAALAVAEGRRKLDVILDSRDPEALVRSLPAEDVYFAIQELGLEDAGPLVRLADAEQFRTFVDLDVWEDYELQPRRLLLWLRLARGEDVEAYREKVRALDIEVLELLVRGVVRVVDLEEDEGAENEDFEGTVERTPEGRFLLVYSQDGPEYAAARRLVEELYEEDPFQAGRFLYAIRWEFESELVETALRWRQGRLADLGFPSPEEAASLYARIDPKAALPPPPGVPDQPPGFFLARPDPRSFLDRSVDGMTGERREDVALELVTVLNAALVADRIHPSELEKVEATALAVRGTLSLGLESLAGSDPARGAAILSNTALKRVFQVGFTKTLELRWRAERAAKELPLRMDGAFLPDFPWGEGLSALFLHRPRFAFARGRRRPFGSLEDVSEGERALEAIEEVGRALQDRGLDLQRAREAVLGAWGEAGLARVRWSDLLLTSVARGMAGLEPRFDSLPSERLEEAIRATFDEEGKVRPEAEAAILASLGDGGDPRGFAAGALRRLEEELGPQVVAGVDPRFAAPWIVGSPS